MNEVRKSVRINLFGSININMLGTITLTGGIISRAYHYEPFVKCVMTKIRILVFTIFSSYILK